MSNGWIGVDLDGTLAQYDGWQGPDHIGEPIPAMAERVKEWLGQGIEVRIVTARATVVEQIQPVNAWCLKHFGRYFPVTFSKDFAMMELWDDRCVQVMPNTGMTVGEFTAQATLKAVAEWWNEPCKVHLEGYSPRRIDCRVCVHSGLQQMGKGQMPDPDGR